MEELLNESDVGQRRILLKRLLGLLLDNLRPWLLNSLELLLLIQLLRLPLLLEPRLLLEKLGSLLCLKDTLRVLDEISKLDRWVQLWKLLLFLLLQVLLTLLHEALVHKGVVQGLLMRYLHILLGWHILLGEISKSWGGTFNLRWKVCLVRLKDIAHRWIIQQVCSRKHGLMFTKPLALDYSDLVLDTWIIVVTDAYRLPRALGELSLFREQQVGALIVANGFGRILLKVVEINLPQELIECLSLLPEFGKELLCVWSGLGRWPCSYVSLNPFPVAPI